jgi:hypothetical protein
MKVRCSVDDDELHSLGVNPPSYIPLERTMLLQAANAIENDLSILEIDESRKVCCLPEEW